MTILPTLNTLLNELYPYFCYHCGREGHSWCWQREERDWPLCLFCRRSYHPAGGMPSCPASLPLLTVGNYHDPQLRAALHDWKYQGCWAVSQNWAVWLAEQVVQRAGLAPVFVPIPLHPSRERSRGYNQAAVLAGQIADAASGIRSDLLVRIRATVDQTRLTPAERQTNLEGAFTPAARQSQPAGELWLVDDVVTTGATVQAAIATLAVAKLPVTGVAAIASA